MDTRQKYLQYKKNYNISANAFLYKQNRKIVNSEMNHKCPTRNTRGVESQRALPITLVFLWRLIKF